MIKKPDENLCFENFSFDGLKQPRKRVRVCAPALKGSNPLLYRANGLNNAKGQDVIDLIDDGSLDNQNSSNSAKFF